MSTTVKRRQAIELLPAHALRDLGQRYLHNGCAWQATTVIQQRLAETYTGDLHREVMKLLDAMLAPIG